MLVAVTGLGGLIQAVDFPARLAFVLDLTSREDLMNAVALNSAVFNVARVVGPALGGIALFTVGPGMCFLLNAASYLAVLVALWLMRIDPQTVKPIHSSGWRTLVGGLRYLGSHPELAWLLVLVATTSMCGWPFMTLLPSIADTRFDPSEQIRSLLMSAVATTSTGGWQSVALLPSLAEIRFGHPERIYSLLLSTTGLGALAGAVIVAVFGTIERRQHFMRGGVFLVTLGLLGLAVATHVPMAILWSAMCGCGLILFLATCQSVLQLSSGEHNRGQIMGIYAVILSGAVPLGNQIVGHAADSIGTTSVLLGQGVACGLAGLAVFGVLLVKHRSP
jgi:predicted MFS family arabinose efflux permease